jgi:DNA-binding MarR family transcriptional regulator
MLSKPAPKIRSASLSALAEDLRLSLGALKRRLREEGSLGELTPSQTSVLAMLERDGPATVTTLARLEGVRPQSMGATIAVLESAGLIGRASDPKDGRQTILSLTPKCRAWIKAARAAREDWLARAIESQLCVSEQAELARGVALLKRLVRF